MRTYRLHILILLVAFAAVPALAAPLVSGEDADVYEWNFDVYLGDAKVGHHHFRLEQDDGQRKLIAAADFEVKLLFLTLCLQSTIMDGRTIRYELT